jgi:hypothetical protein
LTSETLLVGAVIRVDPILKIKTLGSPWASSDSPGEIQRRRSAVDAGSQRLSADVTRGGQDGVGCPAGRVVVGDGQVGLSLNGGGIGDVLPWTTPGGKPGAELPGLSPRSPLTTVLETGGTTTLVTVAPARTA